MCDCIFCTSSPVSEGVVVPLPLAIRGVADGAVYPVFVLTSKEGSPSTVCTPDGEFTDLVAACEAHGVPLENLFIKSARNLIELSSLKMVAWSGGGVVATHGAMYCTAPSSHVLGGGADSDLPLRKRPRCVLVSGALPSIMDLPVAFWTNRSLHDHFESSPPPSELPRLLEILDIRQRGQRDDFLCTWQSPRTRCCATLWVPQSFSTVCESYYREWQRYMIQRAAIPDDWDQFQ